MAGSSPKIAFWIKSAIFDHNACFRTILKSPQSSKFGYKPLMPFFLKCEIRCVFKIEILLNSS